MVLGNCNRFLCYFQMIIFLLLTSLFCLNYQINIHSRTTAYSSIKIKQADSKDSIKSKEMSKFISFRCLQEQINFLILAHCLIQSRILLIFSHAFKYLSILLTHILRHRVEAWRLVSLMLQLWVICCREILGFIGTYWWGCAFKHLLCLRVTIELN